MVADLSMFTTPTDDSDLAELAASIAEDVSLAKFLRKKATVYHISEGAVTRVIQCPFERCHQSIPEENYPTHLLLTHRYGQ